MTLRFAVCSIYNRCSLTYMLSQSQENWMCLKSLRFVLVGGWGSFFDGDVSICFMSDPIRYMHPYLSLSSISNLKHYWLLGTQAHQTAIYFGSPKPCRGHRDTTKGASLRENYHLYASHLNWFIKNIRSIKVKICIKDIFLCTMRKMQFEASNTLNVCLNVSSHWAHA